MAKCSGITQSGAACKGIPIDGSQWCYVHDPDHAHERRRHGSRGGKRGGRGRPQVELSSIQDRLSTLADDVLEKRVDRGDAAVASQVLNVYLRAISTELKAREVLEFETRLEELEASFERQNGGSRYGA